MSDFRFDRSQLDALRKLGVSPQGIERLEHRTLGRLALYLSPQLPNAAVRRELAAVSKALVAARKAIEGLLSDPNEDGSRAAARSRLVGAGRRYRQDGMKLDQTSRSLAEAIDILAKASAAVPDEPLRHRTADPYPVEVVHRILLDTEPEPPTGKKAPFRPSSSPTSRFRKVVGIVYEAIGATGDPERAIRAYLVEWRKQEHYTRWLAQNDNGTLVSYPGPDA